MHRVRPPFVRCFGSECVRRKSIPRARGLPVLGTIASVAAAGGASKLHLYVDNRHKQLGPIYRERLGSVDGVFISDSDYMRKVFAAEGKYPKHIIPESWSIYNDVRGLKRGLFFMDGEEWSAFRRKLNNVLLKARDADFVSASSVVAQAMTDKWRRERVLTRLEDHLYDWSLQVIAAVLLGSDAYVRCRDELADAIAELSRVVRRVFVESANLSLMPVALVARLNLPPWRRFAAAVTDTTTGGDNLLKLIRGLSERLSGGKGLLQRIRDAGISSDDDLGRIVTDLIIAAGDTTSYTMQWLLHLLSVNVRAQAELYEEVRGASDEEALGCALLRGALKEALRLRPVAPFITRYVPEDVDIDGYVVEAGELVLMSLYSSGRNERYFPEAATFSPGRWRRTSGGGYENVVNANASLPFAIGSRSCIGRKIAETQILVTLLHILRNFELSTEQTEVIDIKLHLISVPEKPVQLILTPRSKESNP